MGDIFKHVPERRLEEGIFVHKQERARVGSTVEAIRTVAGRITKGTRLRIANILVEPRVTRGFQIRLQFDEFPGEEFNPKRFRLIQDGTACSSSNESDERHTSMLRSALEDTLSHVICESRDQHRCPDLTPLKATIVDGLIPIYEHHSLFENLYSDALYQELFRAICRKLHEMIGEELFTENNIRQRRFMLNAWAGSITQALWSTCKQDH